MADQGSVALVDHDAGPHVLDFLYSSAGADLRFIEEELRIAVVPPALDPLLLTDTVDDDDLRSGLDPLRARHLEVDDDPAAFPGAFAREELVKLELALRSGPVDHVVLVVGKPLADLVRPGDCYCGGRRQDQEIALQPRLNNCTESLECLAQSWFVEKSIRASCNSESDSGSLVGLEHPRDDRSFLGEVWRQLCVGVRRREVVQTGELVDLRISPLVQSFGWLEEVIEVVFELFEVGDREVHQVVPILHVELRAHVLELVVERSGSAGRCPSTPVDNSNRLRLHQIAEDQPLLESVRLGLFQRVIVLDRYGHLVGFRNRRLISESSSLRSAFRSSGRPDR